MFVERVPCSRPNTPEEPAVEMVDSHHPPVMSTDDDVAQSRANHQHHHLEQRPPAPQLAGNDNNYYHVYHGTQRQAYTAEEIKQILLQHGHVIGTASQQPTVQVYDQHHHGHQRHPIPSALYPTPPLPAASPSVVRIPMVPVEPNQDPHKPLAGVQQAPNLQPLTVYTERQACTELSPPTDMARYKGSKDYKGLLVTMDGTIGGRSSPAPGTEASPEGHVGQHGTPAAARRKRSFDGEPGSNSCKKGRFSFSTDMLELLETRFAQGRYIAADERKALANTLGIADVQVKNWFQNRRMKWKRQATCHAMASENKPATLSQVPQVMSVPSSVVENMEKLVQHGNITTKAGQAPFYPMKFPCTAPSGVVSQLQPMHLASNTRLPAGAVHPFMGGMASYPHGFAYPYSAATMMQNSVVQNYAVQSVHSQAVHNSVMQIPVTGEEGLHASAAHQVKVEEEECVKEEKVNNDETS